MHSIIERAKPKAKSQSAHFSIAPAGAARAYLAPLPVAALRLPLATCTRLQRLGIRTVADLMALPRASLTRRFGAEVLLRLDQALGAIPEPITPLPPPAPFAFRMTLPEPVGLLKDVEAGLDRLLVRLCARLEDSEKGARRLVFTARRVDQASVQTELRLARPMRDALRIAQLFARGLEGLDAGYGIDQIRLEAVELEALPLRQLSAHSTTQPDDLADVITKLGNRIGLDNITRFLPADSHLPEKSFLVVAAAYSAPGGPWPNPALRPMIIFAPELIAGQGPQPPGCFRWRQLWFRIAHTIGPERIAPEWWFDHPEWRSGVRDYWQVLTHEGRRLWLFFTPQSPGWFVAGEFA
ncbi:MAG: DNA polymerase Y family protein [Rhodobacteraceae bacterium]|nr:DNA polymerase Y family protein [Paracoccaceae bacterium]